ncbi:putative ORFan [Tupanvirus deep ocean]|uniref:ORFan n=2 Tax=Tupanvirus TaxID=2094720 RepID=A0AC62A6N7_9VIRU|nr:putative ORFan [Tupanvirus deep ocean]QKU33451.1 putative ORFan [Tupanvirus deep ocean]
MTTNVAYDTVHINIYDEHTKLNKKNMETASNNFKDTVNRLKELQVRRQNRIFGCIIVFLMILLAFSIATIIMGSLSPGTCDHIDKMGINVSDYILGAGISSFIINLVMIFTFVMLFIGIINEIPIVVVILLTLYSIFSFTWFIIGGVILFRSNLECIKEESPAVVFALVLWCINGLHIFYGCCVRSNRKE